MYLQTFVILTGAISMAFVTIQVKHAQTGPQRWKNAVKQTQSLPTLTTMKKTCFCSIVIMAKNPGWDLMTSPQRVTSLGRIVELRTSQLGQKINQIILEKKTACTHLTWSTTMNGMTSAAVTAINILARKVNIKDCLLGFKVKDKSTGKWNAITGLSVS